MARRISDVERRARLGARHRLAQPADDILDVVRSMVALHSSDPATVFLSTRARAPHVLPADLEEVLYEKRQLARVLGMRRTMWVVPAELAPVVNSSSTAALVPPQMTRTAEMIETAGIATDGARWVREASRRVLEVLESRGQATARDLTGEIPELAEKVTFYNKSGQVQGAVGMSTRVLFLLATQGKIVRGRPLGSWISSQYRWSRTETWFGEPWETLDREQAQMTLLGEWLGRFGPGTEIDMKWWTGWPVTQVRKALAALNAKEVDTSTGPGYVLPDDLDPVGPNEPWVALLPSLDPTTMGWKKRDWYIGGHDDVLFDRSGNAGPTVWVDGRVVGGWAQRKDGEVVFELFEDVGGEVSEAVRVEAARLQEWLGEVRMTPRFRSPHDKKLKG